MREVIKTSKKLTKGEEKYIKSAAGKWKLLASFFVCDIPVEHEHMSLPDKEYIIRELDTFFIQNTQAQTMWTQTVVYASKSGILCAFEVKIHFRLTN